MILFFARARKRSRGVRGAAAPDYYAVCFPFTEGWEMNHGPATDLQAVRQAQLSLSCIFSYFQVVPDIFSYYLIIVS